MVDEPCGGGLHAGRAVGQRGGEPRRILGQTRRIGLGQDRVHEERAAAVTVPVGSGQSRTGFDARSAGGGETPQIGDDVLLALRVGHDRLNVAGRILKHAFRRTDLEHRVADGRRGHTRAHLDAESLRQLAESDRALGAVPQGERDGQHHIARRREEPVGRRGGSRIHARLQRGGTIAELQVVRGQVARRLRLAIPHLHRFDRCGDLLTVRADVLHDGRAHRAGDAGQAFDALQTEFDGEGDEIIPVRASLRVHVHGAVVALDGRRLVGHGDAATRVTHDDAWERLIGDEHVGTATDDA